MSDAGKLYDIVIVGPGQQLDKFWHLLTVSVASLNCAAFSTYCPCVTVNDVKSSSSSLLAVLSLLHGAMCIQFSIEC